MGTRYKPIHKRKKIGEEYIIEQQKKVLLGSMDILIIQWVKTRPYCGQDIINKIKKEFGFSFSSGTIYPILYNLKKRELISSITLDKRKFFHLAPKGKALSKLLTNKYLKIRKDLDLFLT